LSDSKKEKERKEVPVSCTYEAGPVVPSYLALAKAAFGFVGPIEVLKRNVLNTVALQKWTSGDADHAGAEKTLLPR
jgi:hypothetical protein